MPIEPERSVLSLRDHRSARPTAPSARCSRGAAPTRTTTACTSPRRWSSTRRRPASLSVTSITLPDPATVKSGDPLTRELDGPGRRARPTPRREAGRMPSTSARAPPGTLPTSIWARSRTRDRSQPGGSYTGTLVDGRCRRLRRGSTTSSSAPISSIRLSLPPGVPSRARPRRRPACSRWPSTA